MKRVIRAGRLLDGVSETVREKHLIVIAGDTIQSILPEEGQQALLADSEVIDASDKTVMPGLINGHCHLCFSASERPAEDIVSDEELLLSMRSQQHCMEALATGVTTVRDCGSTNRVVLKLRNAIQAGIVRGSRIVSCGRAITSTGGHCHFLGGEADGVEGVRRLSREILKEGADFLKVMVSGGNMTPGSGPNITQFGPDELKIIADEAHMHGTHLSVHVHSATSIRDAFGAGADVYDHCSWKQGDDVAYDSELARQMVEKGVFLCPALGAPYRSDPAQWFKNNPERIAFWKVFREQRFRLTKQMIADGFRVIAGDDAGCRMTKFYDFQKGLQLMVDALGMSPIQVIISATSAVAQAIGLGKVTGRLAPGYDADILIAGGRPDERLESLATPEMVLQKGRLAAIKGRLIL